MSELNIQTADRAELEEMANDLGINFRKDVKDDTLRAKIAEVVGDAPVETGKSLANAPGEDRKAKRYEIIVATKEDDEQPVQVGINGKMYVIKRGEKVIVPASVVGVLNDAVQHHFKPVQGRDGQTEIHETRVMAYPFQIVREL